MMATNLYKELAAATREMRVHQKKFFKSTPGSEARIEELAASRRLEKIVDDLLLKIERAQEEMKFE